MTCFSLPSDGTPLQIAVDDAELETVHLPLLRSWSDQWRQRRGRFIVLLAGPPGSGKTTLAALWEELSRQGLIDAPIQALPMDGFHFPNRVLDSQSIELNGKPAPLRKVKGRPESFDLAALREAMGAIRRGEPVRWPRYDRMLHDPVPGAIEVLGEGILIVEGLYVLLDLPGWRDLRPLADLGILVKCAEEVFRDALRDRRVRQGRNPQEAEEHYRLVDLYAWQLVSQYCRVADAVLQVDPGRRNLTLEVTSRT